MAHSVEFSLKKAKNMLKKGQLEEAEKAFQSILIAFPGNVRAQNGLSSCQKIKDEFNGQNKDQQARIAHLYSNGEHKKLVCIAGEYLKTYPNDKEVLLKFGASKAILGDFNSAKASFEKVIALQPESAAPYNNLGTLCKLQDDVSTAIEYYYKAIEKDPNHFDSLKNLAFCLQTSGALEKSLEYFERVLKIKSDDYELYNHAGSAYSKCNKSKEAAECYKKALSLKPDFNPAINNLANIYYHDREFDKAIELYEKAIENDPNYGDAYNNLANALKDIGFLDEAIVNYEKSIEFQPEKAELYSNYSVALKDKFELDRSLKAIDRALELKPDFHDAHWNKALVQLAAKNYSEGWKNYEWRWQATNFDSIYLNTSKPKWDGKKEKVLIWQEQGIGDQIMFSTMFEEFAELCEIPIFQVDGRLLPIFRRTFPQFYFIPGDKKLAENEYDSHLPMASICQYLRKNELDFANANPTRLRANMSSSQNIRQAFRIGDKTLVGISWRSMNKATGLMRSLSLTEFLTPFAGRDVEIVNLQYGDCKSEIDEAYHETGIAVKSVNEIDTFTNIDHLASLIQACDRVITIDNSTVHLAASMGKPTDLLLPFITDWRWCGGEKIPMWYDCLTVHRAPYGVHLKDCISDLIKGCFQS